MLIMTTQAKKKASQYLQPYPHPTPPLMPGTLKKLLNQLIEIVKESCFFFQADLRFVS